MKTHTAPETYSSAAAARRRLPDGRADAARERGAGSSSWRVGQDAVMATPYHSWIRRQPPNQVDEPGREDDWLADEGGVDWFFDPGRADDREQEWPQQERTRSGLIQSPRVASPPTPEETFQRRRMLALAAIVVAVVIAIVVAVVASGGGGGGTPSAVPTTSEELP